MDLKVQFKSEILKKYKGKKHFTFLHLMKIGDIEYYSLYVVERAGETGIKYKKEFYKNLSIDCPIEEIEKIVKENIGGFEII
ncbi:hypothetical protein [Fusobacterium ulcerans]|uniref:hypothetical protein n=1 Tax=Fusobacterium ulcerans TaxID=861 RepID=UPI00241FB389|nr:hypothetical protein [Fusobacterium ulcerans]